MKTLKNQIILSIFIATGMKVSAQDYFIVNNSDTTFCSELECIVGAQGDLKKVTYKDIEGEEVSIKGKENVQNITTVYYHGITSDKIPQNLNKPDGYSRFEWRAVDGKIIVYQDSGTDGASKNRFVMRTPEGILYDINSKTIEDNIKPYLQECPEFVKRFKGEYSKKEDEFMEMIRLYNMVCK